MNASATGAVGMTGKLRPPGSTSVLAEVSSAMKVQNPRMKTRSTGRRGTRSDSVSEMAGGSSDAGGGETSRSTIGIFLGLRAEEDRRLHVTAAKPAFRGAPAVPPGALAPPADGRRPSG